MPGLAAAIGASPYLYLVAERIGRRTFGPANAMALIRYFDLTRPTTRAHPGVHIFISAPERTRDFHIQGTSYGNRARHRVFYSEDETPRPWRML